jgi:hypothetical protein
MTDLEVLAQVGVLHVLPSEAHRAAPPEDSMQLILLKHGQYYHYDQWMIALADCRHLNANVIRCMQIEQIASHPWMDLQSSCDAIHSTT